MKRFLWLLMLILLVGSLVGAYAATHPSGPHESSRDDSPAGKEEPYVWAAGHVDLKDGVKDLYPRMAGLVKYVAAENDEIDAADKVLLQVDDTLAQRDLEAARAEVAIAGAQLAKAELQARLYPLKIEQLKAGVAALEHKQKMVDAETRITEKAIEKDFKVTDDRRVVLQETRAAAQAQLDAKQTELKEAEESRPFLQHQIDEARGQLDAKKKLVAKATDALELYKVRAPGPGTVLRVLTRAHETLGSNPKVPAVQFRPVAPLYVRAEVLQEWGYLIAKGQDVILEDETSQKRSWKGVVETVSQWYAPTRSPIIEPLKMNDVRTLECLIRVEGDDGALRVGQRVRARIQVRKKGEPGM